VDAFRSLAQHLTWADQHDAQLFDLFVELRVRGSTPDSVPRHTRTELNAPPCAQMVAHFSRVLAQCALPSGSGTAHTAVAVQLLQTLSILVLNTSRVTSMYYLCSNNYLEDVLTCADKQLHAAGDSEAGGSELLAWYVSFLKALSLRLDKHTIQFFVTDAQPPSCRLYAHVLRYITHGDALVRAAARAAVLNVLKVNDGRVLQAALGDDSLRAALCTTLAYDVATCTSRVGAALVAPPAAGDVPLSALPPPWSDVAHACEELGACLPLPR
jgi:protein CLEC16A